MSQHQPRVLADKAEEPESKSWPAAPRKRSDRAGAWRCVTSNSPPVLAPALAQILLVSHSLSSCFPGLLGGSFPAYLLHPAQDHHPHPLPLAHTGRQLTIPEQGLRKAQQLAQILYSSTPSRLSAEEVLEAFEGDPRMHSVKWSEVKGVPVSKLAVTYGLVKARGASSPSFSDYS